MSRYFDGEGFIIANHGDKSYLVRAHVLDTTDDIKVIVREIPYTDTDPTALVTAGASWDYYVAAWRDRGAMTQSVRINTADEPLCVEVRPIPRPQSAARMRSPIYFNHETNVWEAHRKNATVILESIGSDFLRGFARGVFDSLAREGRIA